jgi:hypothetical protein
VDLRTTLVAMPSNGSSYVSDRLLASLAIVKVNFDRDQSFLKNFQPFLRHCLAASDSDAVSAPDLQECIAEDFGLRLPQAVVRTMLRREEGDAVTREHGTYRIRHAAVDGANLDGERAAVERQVNALLESLVRFAQEKFDCDWNTQEARQLLWAYLETFSTEILGAAVAGRAIPAGPGKETGDRYIVHRFVLHSVGADPTSFAFLETVVKGQMLCQRRVPRQRRARGRYASTR